MYYVQHKPELSRNGSTAYSVCQRGDETEGMEPVERMSTTRKRYLPQICNRKYYSDSLRFFVSEFVGTSFMVLTVTCAGAQMVLSRGQSGNIVSSFFGIVLGITFAVYLSLKGSGGHINPIVTLVLVLTKQTQKRHLLVYWAAQYLGAFVGAAIAYSVHFDTFNTFDNGTRTMFGEYGTATIFSSFPQNEDTTLLTCVFDQLLTVSSALLILGILAVIDPANAHLPPHLIPPAAGALVGMIIACLGHNCYAPLNPAKDFSSRILMAIAGWGAQPFSHRGYVWWCIPLVVPHIGATLGLLVYKIVTNIVLFSPIKSEQELEENPPKNNSQQVVLKKLLAEDGLDDPK